MAAAAESPGNLIHPIGRQCPKAGLHRVFPLLMQIIGHANALNVDGVIHYAVCFRRIQTVLTELLQRRAQPGDGARLRHPKGGQRHGQQTDEVLPLFPEQHPADLRKGQPGLHQPGHHFKAFAVHAVVYKIARVGRQGRVQADGRLLRQRRVHRPVQPVHQNACGRRVPLHPVDLAKAGVGAVVVDDPAPRRRVVQRFRPAQPVRAAHVHGDGRSVFGQGKALRAAKAQPGQKAQPGGKLAVRHDGRAPAQPLQQKLQRPGAAQRVPVGGHMTEQHRLPRLTQLPKQLLRRVTPHRIPPRRLLPPVPASKQTQCECRIQCCCPARKEFPARSG